MAALSSTLRNFFGSSPPPQPLKPLNTAAGAAGAASRAAAFTGAPPPPIGAGVYHPSPASTPPGSAPPSPKASAVPPVEREHKGERPRIVVNRPPAKAAPRPVAAAAAAPAPASGIVQLLTKAAASQRHLIRTAIQWRLEDVDAAEEEAGMEDAVELNMGTLGESLADYEAKEYSAPKRRRAGFEVRFPPGSHMAMITVTLKLALGDCKGFTFQETWNPAAENAEAVASMLPGIVDTSGNFLEPRQFRACGDLFIPEKPAVMSAIMQRYIELTTNYPRVCGSWTPVDHLCHPRLSDAFGCLVGLTLKRIHKTNISGHMQKSDFEAQLELERIALTRYDRWKG